MLKSVSIYNTVPFITIYNNRRLNTSMLQQITLQSITVHYITVKFSILHCSIIFYTIFQYREDYYITVQYTEVQYSTLHCTLYNTLKLQWRNKHNCTEVYWTAPPGVPSVRRLEGPLKLFLCSLSVCMALRSLYYFSNFQISQSGPIKPAPATCYYYIYSVLPCQGYEMQYTKFDIQNCTILYNTK